MFKKRKPSANIRKRPHLEEHNDDDVTSTSDEEHLVLTTTHANQDASHDVTATVSRHTSARISTSISSKNNVRKNVMHEYQSNPQEEDSQMRRLTGKDLATAHSEYSQDRTLAKAVKYNASMKKDGAYENNDQTDNSGNIYQGEAKNARNKFLAGPLRAPAFVRTTCVFDYQPNVCKDYKETGFCGFGDSCIYLHDRSDTVAGWQLEKEWEEKRKKEEEKKERQMKKFLKAATNGNLHDDKYDDGGVSSSEDESSSKVAMSDDGLPFACFICRQPFTNPVITTCQHYFCEKCIMSNFQERHDPACPICKKDTMGVFNYPQKLLSKRRRLNCKTWEEFAQKLGGNK